MQLECQERPGSSSGSAHFWLSRRGGLIFSRTLGHGPVLSKSSCSSMSEDHSRSFDLEVRELLLSAVHCTWHSITFLRRVCVIVLRNQVFNRLRALKLLSGSHELAGDNSNRRRSFSTWGKIYFTFEGKLMITKIKGEIQYFYGTFQYISTFSIIYGQNPNFNEKN